MIKLITGIPGSGKTLYAVSMLKKAVEHNESLPLEEQRKIYCDITGLKIDGIEPPPLDWRQTPPNSLLVYDEAQFHKPFQAARGLSPYDYIQELTIHRKTGHEIWYITQDVKRLHVNILEMAETHYHLDRPYGAKLATIFQFRGYERNPRSQSAIERAERKILFKHDKTLYALYESSQVDDGIKLRLPWKLLLFLSLPLLLFAFSAYMFFGKEDSLRVFKGESKKDETVITTDTKPVPVPVPVDDPVEQLPDLPPPQYPDLPRPNFDVKTIALLINNGDNCLAKSHDGETIDISNEDCLYLSSPTYSASFIPMDLLNPIYIDNGDSNGSSIPSL